MDGVKSLFASKTFWSAVIVIGCSIVSFFGYEIGGEDQAALVEHIGNIGAAVGGVFVILSRVKATKAIK